MGFWPDFGHSFHLDCNFSAISGVGPFSIFFPIFPGFLLRASFPFCKWPLQSQTQSEKAALGATLGILGLSWSDYGNGLAQGPFQKTNVIPPPLYWNKHGFLSISFQNGSDSGCVYIVGFWVRKGSSQTWLFQTGCLQFLRGCALLRFCALLWTCVCALLCSFALFCAHLRVSASDRVLNDHVWELQKGSGLILFEIHF